MYIAAWEERAAGRNYTDENGVPANLLLDLDVPTEELDISEDPHTREMTFTWEISTIALILLLLIIPQTSTVWKDTERFAYFGYSDNLWIMQPKKYSRNPLL